MLLGLLHSQVSHGDVRITQDTYAHLAPHDAEIDLLTIGNIAAKDRISDPTSDPDPTKPPPEAPQPAPQPPGEQATPTAQR